MPGRYGRKEGEAEPETVVAYGPCSDLDDLAGSYSFRATKILVEARARARGRDEERRGVSKRVLRCRM